VAQAMLANIDAQMFKETYQQVFKGDEHWNSLQIPQGNRLAFCMYALGVQLYRWTGTTWDFVSPTAMLFGNADQQIY
jgi:hypothetical protein